MLYVYSLCILSVIIYVSINKIIKCKFYLFNLLTVYIKYGGGNIRVLRQLRQINKYDDYKYY